MQDIERAALGEALGGKRNARGLYAVFDNLDTLTSAYETARNSAGSAAEEQEHFAEGVEFSINRAKASLQELAYNFLSSDLLKGLIDGAEKFLSIVNAIVSTLHSVPSILLGGGLFSVIKGFLTNTGLFSGIMSTLADAKLENGASRNTWTNVLGLFRNRRTQKAAKQAGAELMEDVADGAAKSKVIPFPGVTIQKGAEESGKKAGGSFFTSFLGAIKAHPVIAAGIGIAMGAVIAKGIHDQIQESYIETGKKATEEIQATRQSISGYISQYTPLKESLDSGRLSNAEEIHVRQQILGIQQQITEQFGIAASSIDLANGSLETQLGLLQSIANQQEHNIYTDPENQKAFQNAKEVMTSAWGTKGTKLTYGYIGDLYNQGAVGKELRKSLEEAGFELNGNGQGGYTIRFSGNPTELESAIETATNSISKYREKFKEGSPGLIDIDSVIADLANAKKINDDILGKYQEIYKQGLYSEFKEEYKDNKNLVDDYAKAVQEMNTAAGLKDSSAFSEAETKVKSLENELLNLPGFSETYLPIFEEIQGAIDTTAKYAADLRDVFDDDSASDANPYAMRAKYLREYADELKDAEMTSEEFELALLNPSAYGDSAQTIKELAGSLGIVADGSDESVAKIDALKNALVEFGYLSGDVEEVTKSFGEFQTEVTNQIANIDTLNAAMAESFSGKGLSFSLDEEGNVTGSLAAIKEQYASILEDADVDASVLFERTANGIHINQKAMRALQSELENKTKADFLQRENDLLDKQKTLQEQLKNLSGHDKDALAQIQSELDATNSQLESVRDLAAAYDGATSAYQKWVAAQSMGEEGDMYNAIRDTAIARGDELLEEGRVGTNEFRAIAGLFSPESLNLATASIDEIVAAYQNGVENTRAFFTEGRDGLIDFAEAVQEMGPEVGRVFEDAEGYIFENVDTTAVAERLGVSADIIESIFRRMSEYGIDTQFLDSEQAQAISEFENRANAAKETLKDLQEESERTGQSVSQSTQNLLDYANGLDLSELNTKEELQAAKDKLEELSDAEAHPDIDTSSLEAVEPIIEAINGKLNTLDEAHEIPMTVSGIQESVSLVTTLQEKIQYAKSAAAAGINIDIHTDSEINSIATQIASLPKEVLISYGFTENSEGGFTPQDIINQLESGSATIPVDLVPQTDKISSALDTGRMSSTVNIDENTTKTVTVNEVLGDTIEIVDKTATVIYDINTSKPDEYKPPNKGAQVQYKVNAVNISRWTPPNKTATVTYSAMSSVALLNWTPPKKTGIVEYKPSGTPYNGTANAMGTVPSYFRQKRIGSVGNSFLNHYTGTAWASGNWGLKKNEPNALINELGPELVVNINLATLCSDTYVKLYLIAGKPLEPYKLQRSHETRQTRTFKNCMDWAISSEAANSGTFND